jgi:hypothetical protein
MCPLQLIPSLRHVAAGSTALWIPAFGLINRGSQGSTAWWGASAQADDAVTFRPTGETLAAPATRCSSILGGGCHLPTPSASARLAQQTLSTTQHPFGHGIGGSCRGATTPTSGWNCPLTPGGITPTGGDTLGATVLRQAAGWLSRLPHLCCPSPPPTSTFSPACCL